MSWIKQALLFPLVMVVQVFILVMFFVSVLMALLQKAFK